MLTSRLDFDPEDIDNGQQSSDDEGEDNEEVNTGREHYQAVGCVKNRCIWYQQLANNQTGKQSSAKMTLSPWGNNMMVPGSAGQR